MNFSFSCILILFLAASESGLAAANKDKAGKASEEVSLHRVRQHLCDSMDPFEGSFVYQSGCGGNAFEVSITCEDKGRKGEQRDGLTCTFFEKTVNDDSGLCPSSGNFFSKVALSTDANGNCLLGPISIHPVSTDSNKGCDMNAPKLDVKIIQGDSKDELNIFFSNDGGGTYYNEEEPRIALKIPENSGGSSSKGGKKGLKGTNDRRKLVEKTLKQAQRKLGGTCVCHNGFIECYGTAQYGEECSGSFLYGPWCAEGLKCVYYCGSGLYGCPGVTTCR